MAKKRVLTEPWVQMGVRIPKSLHRALRIFAVDNQIPVQDVVAEALLKHLQAREPRKNGDTQPVAVVPW